MDINNAVGDESIPKIVAFKTGVKVTEESVDGNAGVVKLPHNIANPVLYLIEIGMVSHLRLSHCEGYSLIVRKKERIGGARLLSALVVSPLPAPVCQRVGAVYMGYGEVKTLLVEHRLPPRSVPAEKMAYWQKMPLAPALEFIKYCVYNLNKIIFGDEASFCYRKIGDNFKIYCNFVERILPLVRYIKC